MLTLPTDSHPARELFEVADLVNWKALPTFPQARHSAAKMTADGAVHSVNCLVQRADGAIWLVTFGPRGGWQKVWNFGNPAA